MIAGADGPNGIGNGLPPDKSLEPLDFGEDEIATEPGMQHPEPQEKAVAAYLAVVVDDRPVSRPAIRGADQPTAGYFRGIVDRYVNMRLREERTGESSMPGWDLLEAGNGASIYYRHQDDATLLLSGYLHDVLPLLYDLLKSSDGSERFTHYYSPATIARDLEWAHGNDESGEFSNASGATRVQWQRDPDTDKYQFEIRFSKPQSGTSLGWLIERFTDLTDLEITDVVERPLGAASVSRRLEQLLGEAGAKDILEMLRITVPVVGIGDVALLHQAIHQYQNAATADININDGVDPHSGFFVGNIDVGIRMKNDLVSSIVLIFNQGRKIDESGGVDTLNISTWVGSPLPDSGGFVWNVDDSFAAHAKNGDWTSAVSKSLRDFVFGLFKDGLKQLNAAVLGAADKSGPSGGSAPAGSGGIPDEITRAEKTGEAGDAGEDIDETAEYNAGYDDTDTFETSAGVYMDWIVADFALIY